MSKNMGIRGKHRAPDWSRGMRPFDTYDGQPLKFVDNGCDFIFNGICATVMRVGKTGTYDVFFTRDCSDVKVGIVFNFESRVDERIWRRPWGELARRKGVNMREACGYVHALKLGVFKLAR